MLTPTIPGREKFLAECKASVSWQTLEFRFYEHLILLDDEEAGCAATMNALASSARGEWLLPLADDDLLLPRCLELLLADPKADVVYSPPLVWGEDAEQFHASPPNIPAVALVSKALWDKIGGYDLSAPRAEDNAFWRQAEQRGASFQRVDEHPTWVYRLGHGGNKSRS